MPKGKKLALVPASKIAKALEDKAKEGQAALLATLGAQVSTWGDAEEQKALEIPAEKIGMAKRFLIGAGYDVVELADTGKPTELVIKRPVRAPRKKAATKGTGRKKGAKGAVSAG